MIFFGDIVFNQIFFYLDMDNYPLFYTTGYQD
jgi:hypothetical protein